MKKIFFWVFIGVFTISLAGVAIAGHHEEGSKEEGHQGIDLEATKAKMKNVMKDYITSESVDGVLILKEEKSGKVRNLSFMDIHESVGMKGGKHFSCADFKDIDSGEIVDVDIYVDTDEEGLAVSDAKIHKVDGKYLDGDDAKDKGSAKEDHKGSHKGSGY